jgi:hypothetical protein
MATCKDTAFNIVSELVARGWAAPGGKLTQKILGESDIRNPHTHRELAALPAAPAPEGVLFVRISARG